MRNSAAGCIYYSLKGNTVILLLLVLSAAPVIAAQTQISSIPSIEELQGGRFAAAAIDLETGGVLASTGNGSFPLDDPDLFILACTVDRLQNSITSLDSILRRDETPADRFWRVFHWNRDAPGRIMRTVCTESLSAWTETNGMNNTELHCFQPLTEGAAAVLPSMSTTDDVAKALHIIHSGLDINAVAAIIEEPDLGEGQASAVAEGWELYGWVDAGESHKTYALITLSPEGRAVGLIVMTDELCCMGKSDLALMLLWEEVK